MIQKIREAERDALHDEYSDLQGHMVSGVIQRYEGGAATVSLTNCEAILPRSEQIPGETHHVNERVRATVYEVRKAGSRVKVILSRRAPQLVQRLFEQEIPEIADGVIEIRAMSREPGYRSKVAVVSSDQRVDCVGACVGVRGNRIKNIVDELAGERIDIVRWDDNLEVLIPNALQPADVEQVILCKMLGRAIVLVREDQLSLAIGRRGQNVRLASKLSGWDIEIMTQEELAESIDRAVEGFSGLTGVEVELAERLVEEGFLSYDDLSIIEPEHLMEMGGLSEEQVNEIVEQAEKHAEEAEAAAQVARRNKKEQERLAQMAAEAGEPLAADEGDEPDGETADGETADGETADGETADGESDSTDETVVADADSADADSADAETSEETAVDTLATDNSATDNSATDNSATDNSAADELDTSDSDVPEKSGAETTSSG
jgi:N utilization substance protein A